MIELQWRPYRFAAKQGRSRTETKHSPECKQTRRAITLRISRLALLTTAVASIAITFAPPSYAATTLVARPQQSLAVARPAVVLVNRPANSVCSGHKFTVGVWYQSISGGSRAYRVAIWGPRHKRFFYRHGQASAKSWRYWHVEAGRRGRYRVVYGGHKPGSTKWTRYQVITHAKRCHAG
jgi:hypothetical protein